MSSLAAAQADGYYHPPEYDARKGSLRKFTGAKGHNQYLQKGVIRFELPYNSWCLSCQSHLGKGVRFNAKKVQAGSYFTTKIWEFQMKCPNCQGRIVIRTDPKNCDYEFAEGIRRRDQDYDAGDIGLPTLPAPGESSATAVSVDPLVALEREKDDKRRASAAAARLEELMDLSRRTEADSYGVNSLLRSQFRGEKKAAQALEEESLAKGLRFRLAPPSEEDAAASRRAAPTAARHAGFKKDAKSKIARIMGESIFGSGSSGSSSKAASSSTSASALTTTTTSTALVALKRSFGSGSGGGAGSKAVRAHEAKKALAVKRAKLGIDPSNFVVRGSGGGGGGGGGSSGGLPTIVRKKG